MAPTDSWDLDDDMDMDDLFGPAGVGERLAFTVEDLGVDGTSAEAGVELEEGFTLTYSEDEEGNGTVHLKGTVTNLGDKKVEVGRLTLILRDAEGAMVDFATDHLGATFKSAQELVTDFAFYWAVGDRVASAELYAECSREYQRLLAAAACRPPGPTRDKTRQRLLLDVDQAPAKPGVPSKTVEVTAYAWRAWGEDHVLVAVKVTPPVGAPASEDDELIVALRDDAGKRLARESAYPEALRNGALARGSIQLPANTLKGLRRIDIGAKGTMRRVVLLRRLGITR